MHRRLARIGLVLVIVVAALIAWEPSRVAIQTTVLLPNLIDAGPRALDLFSQTPRRTSVEYRPAEAGRTPDLAELWLPAWASPERRAGAMLLVFGVNNLGRNHPAIARVAEGLARTGVAVLVPDSRTLLEGRLDVAEIDGVVRAFETLAARPEVDVARVGIVGFSVGGSLALVAAADARIADEVRWVNAFGAYADAAEYLASVASHAHDGEGGRAVDWQPTALALDVYLGFLLDQVVEADDRELLEATLGDPIRAGERVAPDDELRASLQTDVARAVHDLLTIESLEAARATIASFPDEVQRFIDAISPIDHVTDLRAAVHLMHELDDHHVPFTESRRLATVYGESAALVRHTEFRLFDHVQPEDLDLSAASPELWKLLWHVHDLMVETL